MDTTNVLALPDASLLSPLLQTPSRPTHHTQTQRIIPGCIYLLVIPGSSKSSPIPCNSWLPCSGHQLIQVQLGTSILTPPAIIDFRPSDRLSCTQHPTTDIHILSAMIHHCQRLPCLQVLLNRPRHPSNPENDAGLLPHEVDRKGEFPSASMRVTTAIRRVRYPKLRFLNLLRPQLNVTGKRGEGLAVTNAPRAKGRGRKRLLLDTFLPLIPSLTVTIARKTEELRLHVVCPCVPKHLARNPDQEGGCHLSQSHPQPHRVHHVR